MEKSPDAFRTISEVADWLGVPAHVLRFWESRFTQVRPVKRAGGRRYYRPTDMALLDGIRKLLHDDGMSIRGVQALLKEKGIRSVADLARPMDGAPLAEPEPARESVPTSRLTAKAKAPAPEPEPERPPEIASEAACEPVPDAGLDPGASAPVEIDAEIETEAPTFSPDEAEDAPVPAQHAPEADNTPSEAPAERPEVPEAPMAQDVPLDEESAKILSFVRPSPRQAAPPVAREEEPLLPFDMPDSAPAAAPSLPPAAESPPPAPLTADVPADPADDDSAYLRPVRRFGDLAADPARLRDIRDRLHGLRRSLGDPPRRTPST